MAEHADPDEPTPPVWRRLRAQSSELAVAAGFFVVPVAMVVMAYDFGVEARRLPLAMGWPLVAMTGLNLVALVVSALRQSPAQGEHSADPAGAADQDALHRLRREMARSEQHSSRSQAGAVPGGRLLVAMLGLLVGFFVLGLVLTAPLFTFAFMRFLGGHPVGRSTLVAVVILAAVVGFGEVFNVHVHEGIVGAHLPW